MKYSLGRSKSIIGKTFGKWTVLSRTKRPSPNGEFTYLAVCQCECGTIKEVVVAHLRNGRSRSCGCDKSRYEKMTGSGNGRFKGHRDIRGTVWSHIKNGALNRGIQFLLSIEEVWDLYEKQERRCALTGMPIVFNKLCENSTASLDRIDSSKAYTLDNVWWVHKDVNVMKNIYSVEYFVDVCKLVANNAAQPATDSAVIPQNCGASFGRKKDSLP